MASETKSPAALERFRAASVTLHEIDRIDSLITRLAAGYCVGQNFADLGMVIREEIDGATQIDISEIDVSLLGRLALGGIYSQLLWFRGQLVEAIADVVAVPVAPGVDALLRASGESGDEG